MEQLLARGFSVSFKSHAGLLVIYFSVGGLIKGGGISIVYLPWSLRLLHVVRIRSLSTTESFDGWNGHELSKYNTTTVQWLCSMMVTWCKEWVEFPPVLFMLEFCWSTSCGSFMRHFFFLRMCKCVGCEGRPMLVEGVCIVSKADIYSMMTLNLALALTCVFIPLASTSGKKTTTKKWSKFKK